MLVCSYAADAVKKACPSLQGLPYGLPLSHMFSHPLPLWCINLKGRVSKPDLFLVCRFTYSRHSFTIFSFGKLLACSRGFVVGSPPAFCGCLPCLLAFWEFQE